MKRTMKQWLALAAAGVMTLSMSSCSALTGLFGGSSDVQIENSEPIILKNVTQAKNVILMIGDGMGPQQILAGEVFKGKPLTMQGFPYKTTVETCSASSDVTDSAAAATALATGVRTVNGMVGQNAAGQNLETIVDIAHGLGKSTGVIATEEIYGATPMGFSGHASSRNDKNGLVTTAAADSNVNLFISSALAYTYQQKFIDGGYEQIKEVDDISEATGEKLYGSYLIEATAPSMSADGTSGALDRLVCEALDYLSKDEDGFFLMTEGSHIDHGGHNNDICYMLEELIAFDDAVQAVLEWAKDRDDTVVIVTADHETGGFMFDSGTPHEKLVETYEANGVGDCYEWTTTGHTGVDVNLYINGADIDFASYSFGTSERIKNTDVFQIMKYLLINE